MPDYTRDNIYSEMLKNVIIRFDFSGATDIRRFVDKIKQESLIKDAFMSMNLIPQRHYNVVVTKKVVDNGLPPVTEQQRSILYHFYNCKYEDLDVFLDITTDSVCLSIDCRKRYNGSKRYTKLMVDLMMELIDFDQYITIDRIGVRKIDAQLIPEDKRIDSYFNENYLVAKCWYAGKKESVVLTEQFNRGRVSFKVAQCIDRVPSGEDRAIFDVDAFIMNEMINTLEFNKKELEKFLNIEVQNIMFDLFVEHASISYLEDCKKAKQMQ